MKDWLPFALAASFIVMIGAGVRSNWKLPAEQPPPVPPPPPPPQGSLRDWFGGGLGRL